MGQASPCAFAERAPMASTSERTCWSRSQDMLSRRNRRPGRAVSASPLKQEGVGWPARGGVAADEGFGVAGK